jgi:phosphotransferase system HPr (HPr) family protein
VRRLRLVVQNSEGLHARPAAVFVSKAARFASRIQVRNATSGSQWADAKSILGVLTLGVEPGHEVEIAIDGPDEEQAAAELKGLIDSGLP